jgi:hypothetical protein
MGRNTAFLLVLSTLAVMVFSGRAAAQSGPQASAPGQSDATIPPAPSPEKEEPEEPDFAFVAGGPFTQLKNSFQVIVAGQWGRRNSRDAAGTLHHAEYGVLTRMEWGLTDRWELDVIIPVEGERHLLGVTLLDSTFALADSVVGARYRLLRESSAPFTLTMGPQIIFPSGNTAQATGFGAVGYAWDMAAAKDFGGPIFLLTSLNYSVFPSVRSPRPDEPDRYNIHNLFWGSGLAVRALEKDHGSAHHDLHLFFEYGLSREENLEATSATTKVADFVSVFSPGIRYGFLTKDKKLFEIGVAFPVGLSHATPHHGIVFQIQFEQLFGRRPAT